VGDLYFVSNTASNTVSSFRVGGDGQPELVAPIAATTNPGTIDSVASGRFLYVETGIVGTVDEFRVNADGTLTSLGSVTGLPPGLEGIATN
jgi:6-phosphogluconolactonase (cycloisomerase 2 family)